MLLKTDVHTKYAWDLVCLHIAATSAPVRLGKHEVLWWHHTTRWIQQTIREYRAIKRSRYFVCRWHRFREIWEEGDVTVWISVTVLKGYRSPVNYQTLDVIV